MGRWVAMIYETCDHEHLVWLMHRSDWVLVVVDG